MFRPNVYDQGITGWYFNVLSINLPPIFSHILNKIGLDHLENVEKENSFKHHGEVHDFSM